MQGAKIERIKHRYQHLKIFLFIFNFQKTNFDVLGFTSYFSCFRLTEILKSVNVCVSLQR